MGVIGTEVFISPDVLFPHAETGQIPDGGRTGRDCERGPNGDAAGERGVSAASAKHRSYAGAPARRASRPPLPAENTPLTSVCSLKCKPSCETTVKRVPWACLFL